jgi:type IX secretion system PorP/SprF family membrane protein
MHLKKLQFSLLFLLLVASCITAQDIHFTQYNMSQMTLNPANTGGFEGTVRVGGIYRSQWTSVLKSNQYETPSLWVDAPIIRGFRRNDWVGVGLMLFQDKVGVGSLVHSASKLGAAYHLGLGKSGKTVLTLGAHYGQETYRVGDPNEFRFGDGLKQGNYLLDKDYIALNGTTGGPSNNDPKSNYSDFDAGIALTSKLNKTTDFKIGFAVFHLGQPSFGLPTGGGGTNPGPNPTPTPSTGSFRQPRRYVATGVFNLKTSDRMTISPSFLFQTMNKQDEIMVQGLAGYLFDPEKDITLQAGLGYRLGDAINLIVGAKKKGLTVGLAYDVNTSGLNNDTRNRGGFEIAANYVVKIYKKAVVKPKLLCPRF